MELLALPREMVGEIISFTSISDLLPLHITSKLISQITYESVTHKLVDPLISVEESSKYKKLRDSYTKTICFHKGCTRETRRKLFCSEHIPTTEEFYNVNYGPSKGPIERGIVVMTGDEEEEEGELDLLFTKSEGHYVCRGSVYSNEGTLFPLKGEDLEMINGHKYVGPSPVHWTVPRFCSHTTICEKNPRLIVRCSKIATEPFECEDEFTFCENHKENNNPVSPFRVPEGFFLVSDEENHEYIILSGELVDTFIELDEDGDITTDELGLIKCEKYGFVYVGQEEI